MTFSQPPHAPTLSRIGNAYILDLGSDENQINPAWLDEIEGHLATVEGATGPRALVTSATGKFWSNGLDIGWLMAHSDQIPQFTARVHDLLARVLELGIPTVAAIQGHSFGAAAMLALAHDERIMRTDRGYFCFPEVDIAIPFSIGMTDLITSKLSPATAHDAMTTGRRYGGEQALAAGIVNSTVAEDAVLSTAIDRANELAPKAGDTLRTIKARLYRSAIRTLRQSNDD